MESYQLTGRPCGNAMPAGRPFGRLTPCKAAVAAAAETPGVGAPLGKLVDDEVPGRLALTAAPAAAVNVRCWA